MRKVDPVEDCSDLYRPQIIQQTGDGQLNAIMYSIAAFGCASMVALGAYGLYKLTDLSERMAGMEAKMSILLERK